MKKVLLTLVAMLGIAVAAQASSYKVDDSAIDNMIENAVAVDAASMAVAPAAAPAAKAFTKANGKEVKPATALVLNFFLGFFGVHRHYLGTSGWMWALYTFTGGGLGIVNFVDFIMLIVGLTDDHFEQYIDNRSFLMWV